MSQKLLFQNFSIPPALKIALKKCLTEDSAVNKLCNNYIQFINTIPSVKSIQPAYYLILFKILLYLEDYELQVIAAQHNLTNQILKESFDRFIITVLTLNEDDPFVAIGDIVKLQNANSKQVFYSRVVDIDGKDISVSLFHQ